MHVAIDMNKMRVIHVHRVQDILDGLVCLEAANIKDILFENTQQHSFISGLPELEMKILYRNITGEKDVPSARLEQRATIAAVIESISPQLVDDLELDAQITSVQKQLEGKIGSVPFFKYVLGSRKPKIGTELLSYTKPLDDKLRDAAKTALQRLQTPAATPVPFAPLTPAASQKTGVSKQLATPAMGTVAQMVWHVADKVWEVAHRPKDIKIILQLCTKIIEDLEKEQNVNRTISATFLGEWIKARIS